MILIHDVGGGKTMRFFILSIVTIAVLLGIGMITGYEKYADQISSETIDDSNKTAHISESVGETVDEASQPSIASAHADFIIYESLSEIENYADLIVLARFTGERKMHEYKTSQGFTILKNSISTIETMKVYKGEASVDQSLQILEPGYYENQEQEQYNTIEGYNLLNEAGEYVLFLRENDASSPYTIVGMYQGKYDLNKPDQVNASTNQSDISSEYLGPNVEQFNKLKQEVLAKYGGK